MKRITPFLLVIGFLSLFAGCKTKQSEADAIRAGINQHLTSLKTINLGAMDMSVLNFSIQGNQAQAQVEFRPKNGAPQGAAMQVSYTLQKQNGAWIVQNTQAAGGTMQHPAPGENPQMNPNSPSTGSMPNFRDLVHGGNSPTTLPPGHPSTNGQGNPPAQ